MAVNTQRAWAPDLFSHGMIQCVLGVSLQNCKKCKEKCYCEPVNWKCIIFSLWKLNNCNDKPIHPPPKKNTGSFFSSLQQEMWSSIWVFQKWQASCHLLLWSHLTIPFPLIKLTTCMEVNTHRTLSPDILCQVMVQWILCVSLYNCERDRRHTFVKLGFGALC